MGGKLLRVGLICYIYMPVQYTVILQAVKIDNLQMKKCDIFLSFASNKDSSMNIYAYSCLKLLSNRPEAILKQQSPCSNHEIHVPFEHGF